MIGYWRKKNRLLIRYRSRTIFDYLYHLPKLFLTIPLTVLTLVYNEIWPSRSVCFFFTCRVNRVTGGMPRAYRNGPPTWRWLLPQRPFRKTSTCSSRWECSRRARTVKTQVHLVTVSIQILLLLQLIII